MGTGDQSERAVYQPFQQVIVGSRCVNADPVFRITVVRFVYKWVMLNEFAYFVGLTFHGDMSKVVDVEIDENVSVNVHCQDVFPTMELLEREFLFDSIV